MDRIQGRIAPDRLTLLAFLGLVLFGGGNAIAVKATVAELAPFWSAAFRFILAGLLLTAIVIVARRPVPRGRSLTGAALYGVVGMASSFAFIYPALREAPAGTAMVLLSLMPLMTFGLTIAQRQEKFHPQGLLGALIALAGVAVVFADQLSTDVPLASLILILLGTAAVAEGGIIVKWIPRSDPFATNAVASLVGAVILLGLALATGESLVLPTQQATWAGLVYVVLIGSVVLFSLYVFTLKRWTASAVSYMTLLMPLVTLPAAALLLDEQVTPSFLVGGALVLAGVYVGAFMNIRPRRSAATSLPECLPIDAAAEPEAASS